MKLQKKAAKLFKARKFLLPDILAVFFCILFSVAGSIVSVIRYLQFEVFYYDFGIYDGAIWRIAQFKAPIIEHFVHRDQWIFADHLNPSVFLLSPLYWLTDRSEIILIAQAVIFGACGYLIYVIGKIITKNSWYALCVLLSFILFVGLQNAVITDFHETCLTVLFFLLAFLTFIRKRWILLFVFLFLMLGTKESNYSLGVATGLTLVLLDKKQWRIGVGVIVISIIYGWIASRFIIPYFSGGDYQYSIYYSLNPLDYLKALVNSSEKIRTIFMSLASFGFLPLLFPPFYILILQDFLARFYPPYLTLSWGLGFHYSAVLAAIMSISSLYSIRVIERKIKSIKIIYLICILLVLNAIFLYRFILRGPLALSYNSAFYTHTKDFKFLNDLIKNVPKDGRVATQNNLAAHLSHQKVYLLQDKCDSCRDYPYVTYKPQYIVLDTRDGQNLNNFYGLSDYRKFLKAVIKDKNYKIFYHVGDQYIFKRTVWK